MSVEEIKKLIDLKRSANFDNCIDLARNHFEVNFNHSIQNLLNMFPHDAKDKDGQPFWSGPKRAPSHISYDSKDPIHALFVTACANLIAFNLGIPMNRDQDYIAAKAASSKVPELKFTKMKVELPGEEGKA